MEYMKRKKYYVPKEESTRFYGRQGDANANDFIFESDFGHDVDAEDEWQ